MYRMRIAVLISGYFRSFEKTVDRLKIFIRNNSDHQFDLFFLVHDHPDEQSKYMVKNSFDLDLIASLSPKILMTTSEMIKKRADRVKGQFGTLSQLYREFCDYKNQTSTEYDLIVRSRFDVAINDYRIRTKKAYEGTIIAPKGFFRGVTKDLKSRSIVSKHEWRSDHAALRRRIDEDYVINDRFAIGDTESMHWYCSYGDYERDILKKINMHKVGCTEGGLCYFLKHEKNLKVNFHNDLSVPLIKGPNHHL